MPGKENIPISSAVICLGSLSRGGAERVALGVASELMRKGSRVTVATTFVSGDEYPVPDGAERVISGLEAGEEAKGPAGRLINIFRRIRKLRRLFADTHPDLILSFIGKNNIMALIAARPLKIPVVVSVRADPAMEYDSAFLKLMADLTFPKAAGVIFQTERAGLSFPDTVRNNSVILPNPIRDEFLNTPLCPDNGRERTIVNVGRLDSNKNQVLIMRAFHRSGIWQKEDGWRLLICGDGEDMDKLSSLSRELGIEDAVELAGSVKDVAGRIKNAEVFVLASRQEGMPNALIEAMALGLCPVSTDCPCGGPAELIDNGENGLLLPLEDDSALEISLSESFKRLASDDGYRRMLGSRAAADMRRRFDTGTVYGKWTGFLEKAVKSYSSSGS